MAGEARPLENPGIDSGISMFQEKFSRKVARPTAVTAFDE
jgi:hypothetical protein